MIEVWTDGLCEPRNPEGTATFGILIKRGKELIYSGHGVVGEGEGMTSIVAEYAGVVDALRLLLGRFKYNDEKIVFYTDNQVVEKQMNGEWGMRQGDYLPYAFEAQKLKANFKDISWQWVPREQNEEADQLSRDAYEAFCEAKGRKVKYHRRKG